jgi:WhiB family redox-sensing transcriptional regulator
MVARPDVEEFAELLTRPRWHRHAACRDVPHADRVFFPERGQTLDDARRLCAACPVRAQCLTAHLGERWGVWGGLSERERRGERRRRLERGESWPVVPGAWPPRVKVDDDLADAG